MCCIFPEDFKFNILTSLSDGERQRNAWKITKTHILGEHSVRKYLSLFIRYAALRRSFCRAALSGCGADKAVFKGLSKVVTRVGLLRLVIGSKINLSPVYQLMRSKTNHPLYAWIFPALRASYCWLLGILIASSCSVLLLWLVAVTTLILAFRHSFENRSINHCFACVCFEMFAHLSFRTLTRLMDISTDPIILAVAAHDTGEYVRHYPRGKQWVFRKYRYFRVSKNLKMIQAPGK